MAQTLEFQQDLGALGERAARDVIHGQFCGIGHGTRVCNIA